MIFEEDHELEVSLTWAALFFRKICVNCGAEDVEVEVDGAGIGCSGLKCKFSVKSGLSLNASSYFGFLLIIPKFSARATLLVQEIQELTEEKLFFFSLQRPCETVHFCDSGLFALKFSRL